MQTQECDSSESTTCVTSIEAGAVVSLPVTASRYKSKSSQLGNLISSQTPSKYDNPYVYTRTGSGSACEDGAKVLFTIGHPPASDCSPLPSLGHHNCGKVTCTRPECYEPIITRQAREVERHLKAWADLELEKGINPGKIKHIELSPSQRKLDGLVILGIGKKKRAWTIAELEADGASHMERQLYSYLKEAFQGGYFAGSVVCHMERKKHRDGSNCEDGACTRRHTWRPGPHFHFTGYGHLVNSEYFHARTGWIYKNIEPGAPRDIYETVRYQLSHSAHFHRYDGKGSRRSRPAYRLVGLCSSYYLGSMVVSKYDEQQNCIKCQRPLHKYAVPEVLKLDGPEIKDYHKEQDLGPYVLARNDKVFYQKLRYRSHCLGRHTIIYPAIRSEEIKEKIERSREVRRFKKELKKPLWEETRFAGVFNNPALLYKPERRVDRHPKWWNKHSWDGQRLVGWKYRSNDHEPPKEKPKVGTEIEA